MTKNKKIEIIGSDVAFFHQGTEDYISLTDLAKHKNAEYTGVVISHWLSTRYTVEFMGIWERVNNPNFNLTEFSYIRNESGSNGYVLSAKQWIQKTNAIGIISKAGRYGGTYAHKDIAFEFATWISPELKFYLIKEFQRLKEKEQKQLVCLANLETLNAHLIQQALPQAERLRLLNNTAIQQMRLLTDDQSIKKLGGNS